MRDFLGLVVEKFAWHSRVQFVGSQLLMNLQPTHESKSYWIKIFEIGYVSYWLHLE